MGTFDSFADAAFQIKTEGEKITLTFKQGVPNSGQGTVEWNIPTPAHGCAAGEQGAYCGIVILLSTIPLSADNIPENGKVYSADPTANYDLHSGDRIGNALVVGAFYEGEKKNRGEELTTSFVINDLQPGVPYYVAGYAVDCQYRYHRDGVRAYSDAYGSKDEPNDPARQLIKLNNGEGALPTDGTQLIPGQDYYFSLNYVTDWPTNDSTNVYDITVNGSNAGTFEQLIAELNKQFSLIDNPQQSPIPPNAGRFFWDSVKEKLYQFDGTNYVEINSVITFPTDPTTINVGSYWYDDTNDVLYRWDGSNWIATQFIKFASDPSTPECDVYWFNGTQGYQWNGTTWCEVQTFSQIDDPANPPQMPCGAHWFNTDDSALYQWNDTEQRWELTQAIYWHEPINNISVNTYWFNLTNSNLYQWDGSAWNNVFAIVDSVEPSTPAPGVLWFNPSTEELKQWNDTTTTWDPVDVIVWATQPNNISSCDKWWNSVTDVLYVWDAVNNEWDQVSAFYQTNVDPTTAQQIEVGAFWNNTGGSYYFWNGASWTETTPIISPNDPTQPQSGDVWFNATNNIWYVYDVPVAGTWNSFLPIVSTNDPNTLPNGVYWYDTTSNALFVRNGVAWQNVSFTTIPLTPPIGERWFNTSTDTLLEWSGSSWVEATPLLRSYLDKTGNLIIETTETGSVFYVEVEKDSDTLFRSIPGASIDEAMPGNDGLPGTSTYDIIGIGDDGTPDERRELMDSIRAQLGYPVVDVELTTYQLDTAVQAAIESLRKRSSFAYRRTFFFLDVQPHKQRYKLTNKAYGYHKIVNVLTLRRFTSAFLSSAYGSGVYGQVVLQHLYNMGTFDLSSFYLVSQYVEQLEHLFSTRLTFSWDEDSRELDIYNSFARPERILMEATIERTEQSLFKNRWTKSWIERYALAEARIMLAEIRGKYASLPGAGGGVSLNASDLYARADLDRQELLQQLDDYVAQDIENYGMGVHFTIG